MAYGESILRVSRPFLIGQVLIGDIKLAKCFWQQYTARGDPVRIVDLVVLP